MGRIASAVFPFPYAAAPFIGKYLFFIDRSPSAAIGAFRRPRARQNDVGSIEVVDIEMVAKDMGEFPRAFLRGLPVIAGSPFHSSRASLE